MLKEKGVYTSKCPKCSRSILMHLTPDGSISPNKCYDCDMEFEGIDKGEQRNTFVVIVKEKKSTVVGNEGVEENKKTDEKKSFEIFSSAKKAGKRSLRW